MSKEEITCKVNEIWDHRISSREGSMSGVWLVWEVTCSLQTAEKFLGRSKAQLKLPCFCNGAKGNVKFGVKVP